MKKFITTDVIKKDYAKELEDISKKNPFVNEMLKKNELEGINEDTIVFLSINCVPENIIEYGKKLLLQNSGYEWFTILFDISNKGEDFLEEIIIANKNNIDVRFAKKYLTDSSDNLDLLVFREDFLSGKIDEKSYKDITFYDLKTLVTENNLETENISGVEHNSENSVDNQMDISEKYPENDSIFKALSLGQKPRNNEKSLYDRLLTEIIGQDSIKIAESYINDDSIKKALILLNKASESKINAENTFNKMKQTIISQAAYIKDLEQGNKIKDETIAALENDLQETKSGKQKFENAYLKLTKQISAVQGSITESYV